MLNVEEGKVARRNRGIKTSASMHTDDHPARDDDGDDNIIMNYYDNLGWW